MVDEYLIPDKVNEVLASMYEEKIGKCKTAYEPFAESPEKDLCNC